jgi:hypothetical protein
MGLSAIILLDAAGEPFWRRSRQDLDKLMTTLDVTFVTPSECVLAAGAHKVDGHMAKLMQHDPSAPRSTPMMYLAARLTASCETCIRMRLPARSPTHTSRRRPSCADGSAATTTSGA